MKNVILLLLFAIPSAIQAQTLTFDEDTSVVDLSLYSNDPPMFAVDFPVFFTMTEDPDNPTIINYKILAVETSPGALVEEVEFHIGPPPGVVYSPGNLEGSIMAFESDEAHIGVFYNTFILDPNEPGGSALFTIAFSNEANVPLDTITLIVNACLETAELEIISYTPPVPFCPGAEIVFTAPVGYESYEWSNGSTTNQATIVVENGEPVTLDVTNAIGCYGEEMIYFEFDEPVEQPLCFVTVDDVSGKNRLLWEKTAGLGIDSFLIYKQGVAVNEYDLIGSQHFDEFSEFIDYDSNPLSQSERYQIAAQNSCGIVGGTLGSHKTVHLTSNVGINSEVNLIWEPYEGLQFSTYNIYRGVDQNSLSLIAQRPSNTFTYTDFDAPTGTLIYQIEIEAPMSCDPSRAENSIRSNISEANTVGLNELARSGFSIAPNPAGDFLELKKIPSKGILTISNSFGRQVQQIEGHQEVVRNIDITDLSPGVYHISLEGITGAIKFIKL